MSGKIQIVTTVSAWPEALEFQSKLLKKYCGDDFEFIAIVDTDPRPHYSNLWIKNAREKAIEIANRYCDTVIELPEYLHQNRSLLFPETSEFDPRNPALRCAVTCQFAWQHLKQTNCERAILIDSDMFPIRDFNFESMIKGKSVGAVHQVRKNEMNQVEYFWNGILAADFVRDCSLFDISFDAGIYNELKTDAGGGTYIWVLNNYKKINWLNSLSSLTWSEDEMPDYVTLKLKDFIQLDDRNELSNYYSEIYMDTFFHFRAGGNWNAEPSKIVIKRRIKLFEAFCDMLFEELNIKMLIRQSLYSRLSEFKYKGILKSENVLRKYIKRGK
jgi:hypothetical protein